MLMDQIRGLEQNKVFFEIGRLMRKWYYIYRNRKFMHCAKKRSNGYVDNAYKDLLELKNTHLGERCFIIATGPSLTLKDVESLNGEFTFAMNSVCLLYGSTEWRPSFYAVQDMAVYEKLSATLRLHPQNVYVSDNICRKYSSAQEFKQFPLNWYYNYYDYRYTDKLHVKFSNDAYSVVYDAYSITFSLMQIAIYMGFSEIYLLGCDCNQKIGQKNHFIENGHVEEASKLATSAERNIYSHQEIKKYCDSIGVKVFNATRGGKLEIYPRVNLDDVLKQA